MIALKIRSFMSVKKRNIILGLATIIFFVGLGITLYLVQRNQDIREDASSGAACSQSGDCLLINNPGNSGAQVAPRNILYVDITNQDVFRFNPGSTNDGCYNVSISGNQVVWSKVGSGSSCKDISNIQIWMGDGISSPTPTLTPTTTTPTGPATGTPTGVVTQSISPTANPSTTLTPTKTPTPVPSSSGTGSPTPTPSEPPRGGADTPTPTITLTPTTGDNPTSTPTSESIVATSPTPGGDALPKAGVGTLTVLFSTLGIFVLIGAGMLFL